MQQTTLAAEAVYNGIGLHSGREVHLVMKPAPADTLRFLTVMSKSEGAPNLEASSLKLY